METSGLLKMTSKSIDTVVEDIYKLLEEGAPSGCPTPQFLDEFCNAVREAATSYVVKRDRPKKLRMSMIGKPDRQIYYELNDDDDETDEKLEGHTLFKFFYGHLIEAALLYLAKEAGHEVTEEQKEVSLGGVLGHKDCRIDGVTTDVKSASTYAFRKFKDGTLEEDDPFGYMEQLGGYVTAEGGGPGAFLVADKTLGHLTLMKVDAETFESLRIEDRIEHLKGMNELPPRCYDDVPEGKSGNRTLDVGCSYCTKKHKCWADANGGVGLRTFLYSSGPKYLTHVEREPNVREITF